MRVAVSSSLGGFSKVWKGAGEGSSHSRPSAASRVCSAKLALATHHRDDDEQEEQDLRDAEAEGADGGHLVEVGELHGVVGVAARHAASPRSASGRR